jgi:hypothetical protein
MALGMKAKPIVILPAIEYAMRSSVHAHVTIRCAADRLSATKRGTPDTRVTTTSWLITQVPFAYTRVFVVWIVSHPLPVQCVSTPR